jgi:uncharacterized protein (DUF58 family)
MTEQAASPHAEEPPSRFHAWLRARMRERVTGAGVAFIMAVVMVGVAAFLSANNLLFLLLATMLATLMVSGFVSRLGLSDLELDVQLPEHVCARRITAARIQLRNEKRWIPSFSIHLAGVEGSVFSGVLYFPLLAGGATLEETMEVRFARRGLHREDSFQFSSRFPFGFGERRRRVTMARDVVVYPALDAQPGFEQLLASTVGEAEARARGRGHDFYRIRPYEPLESARHVDWRATAHTGQLQVREFARDEDPAVTLLLDLESMPEAEWFELAVECCAFLAWRLSNRSAKVRLRTQEFDLRSPSEGDVYVILRYLALVESRRQAPLLQPPDDDCVQLLFTPRTEDHANLGWSVDCLLDPRRLAGTE